MKLKNFILSLLYVILLISSTFSATDDTLWGNIKVSDEVVYRTFIMKYSYKIDGISHQKSVTCQTQNPIGYQYKAILPWNADGITFTPEGSGYAFEPPYYVLGEVSFFDQMPDFTAIDIEGAEVTLIAPTSSTWVINVEDSVMFNVVDNSFKIIGYRCYYSTDEGSTYNLISSVVCTTTAQRMASSHTPLSLSTKRIVFTPTTIGDQYKFKFEAIDSDSSIGIGYSGILSVIDTIKPTVSVTAPNSSEVWFTNTTQYITWSASDNIGIKSRVIYYSSDNGSSWTFLDSLINSSSPWAWAIPNAPSSQCLIKVKVYDQGGNVAEDICDVPFEIKHTVDVTLPVVFITAPLYGEYLQRNMPYNITWVATDERGVTGISIYHSTNGTNYSKLDSMTSNPGTWRWDVPNSITLTNTIKIFAYDSSGNRGEKISGIFKIKDVDTIPPTIVVQEPLKGSVFNSGFQFTVRTISTDNFGLGWVHYFLSLDGGNTYTFKDSTLHSQAMSTCFFGIREPFTVASGRCKIKVVIYDLEGNQSTAYSDSLFKIKDNLKPEIDLSPIPDVITSGTDYIIEWNSFDWVDVSSVLLSLSTDSGLTFTRLDSVPAEKGLGDYTWTTPSQDLTKCFIKIQAFDSEGNASVESVSGLFMILTPSNVKHKVHLPSVFNVRTTKRSIIISMERTDKVLIEIFSLNGRKLYTKTETLNPGYHYFSRIKVKGLYILTVKRSDETLLKRLY